MRSAVDLRSLLLLFVLAPTLAHPVSLLENTLESLRDADTAMVDGVPLLSGRLLADFYHQRGNEVVWTDPVRLRAFLEVLEDSHRDGFAPEDFHAGVLRALISRQSLADLPEAARIGADIKLSDALLRYVHHTRFGKLDPVAVDPKWNDRAPVPAGQILADMQGALDAEDVRGYLAARFEPPFWYEDLRRALGDYAGMARLKDLTPLPSGANLAIGSRGPRVALVRERLQWVGVDADHWSGDLELFDEGLRSEVIAFQRRLGLSPDGIVGPATLAALNRPFEPEKLEQIRINLERMRWLYHDLPPDYLFVDIADYRVHLVRAGEIRWSSRVIVGKRDAQTPMFRDRLEHLVFNPTWSVPLSIQKKMGRVSAHYTLVDRRTGRKLNGGDASNYKRYRVVQKPGPANALGRVKFMFPNRHAVYLHDTPSKGLFRRSRRALSHGCVRVQNPFQLAELVLDRPTWDQARIRRVVRGNRTRYVNLDQSLPVLLYYLTARADGQGRVSFRPDIYGRDESLRRAFTGPVLEIRVAFPDPPAAPSSEEPGPLRARPTQDDLEAPNQPIPLPEGRLRLTETEQPVAPVSARIP